MPREPRVRGGIMALGAKKPVRMGVRMMLQCDNLRCNSKGKRVSVRRYQALMAAGLKSRPGSKRAREGAP